MKENRKSKWWIDAVSVILGLACMLALGALFYGVMAHQLAGGEIAPRTQAAQTGGVLKLNTAQLLSEQTQQARCGGQRCTVLERRYALENGGQVTAITASPAAYMERLSEEGWMPEQTTGLVLAGMEAICAVREEPDAQGADVREHGETGTQALLCARYGETVYLLIAQGNGQELAALGETAQLEQAAGA